MKLFLMGNGKKIALFLAITLAVIANLLLGSSVSAKKIELNSNDVERIKLVLDLTKLISSIAVSDDKLKMVLNITTKGAESGADITYGLLVLTSLNEMDFIDSVISQRYKKEADAYFNSVLDERLNLRNYYKGIGYDLPRVLAGRITSPMAALTLNTFGITEKTVAIFTELNVLKKEMLYDGLWFYFDIRKNGNELHKVAWSDAKDAMGFAAKSSTFLKANVREDGNIQLESQFLALYEKWGPYVEINKGVKKEFKEQVKQELQNTLALAAEQQALAEKEKENKLSFLEKLKLTLVNLMKEAEKAMAKIQELAGLGGAQVSQAPVEEIANQGEIFSQLEIGSPTLGSPTLKINSGMTTDELQEVLDDIAEKIDILSQKVEELTGQKGESKETVAENSSPRESLPVVQNQQTSDQTPAVVFNYGVPTVLPEEVPLPPQIFITEIQIEAASSTDYDFIELYNPSTTSVNLSGFQLKKRSSTGSESSVRLFPSGSMILAQSYFLWLNSNFASNSPEILANIISAQTLAKNNSVALFDKKDNLLDAVAWGTSTNPFVEGSAFSQNPLENQSIGRKWSTTTQNYIDTDNNRIDFEIQTPTPRSQNQSPGSEPEPEPTPPPEPEPTPEPETPLLTVAINEIAWMGTKSSSADEWIELYNNTTSTIDLTGWILSWSHGTTTHSFSFATSTGATTISDSGFYLLERTASDTTDLTEDRIYTGALNNDGEKLELRDGQNNLIDSLDFSAGWPAGSSTPNYISMERINSTSSATSTNWANNNLLTRNSQDVNGNKINGTPRSQNSVSVSSTAISGLLFDEFSEITLTYLGSPYLIWNDLTIPESKTLKIEPNVMVKLKGNSGSDYSGSYNNSNLIVKGKLLAQGQAGKEIIFTSFLAPSGSIGWWGQIYFASSSQSSVLENVIIKDGGKKQADSYLIVVDSTSVTLKNSILENFAISGLSLIYSSSTVENLTIQSDRSGEAIRISGGNPTIKKSIFRNTYAGMIIGGGSTALIEDNTFEGIIYSQGSISVSGSYPTFKNNIAVNNALNGIYIFGNINQNWTLNKDLPYVINNSKVSENVTLTVEPGAIIKFLVSGRLDIDGTLSASSSSERIVFTSLCDNEYGGKTRGDTSPFPCGYWDRIYFSPLGQNSVLKNVVVNYGGVDRAVYVLETKVEFENLLMKNLGNYGLYIENSPETVVADSHFENIPVAIQIAGGCPQLSGLTFESYSHTILPEECRP